MSREKASREKAKRAPTDPGKKEPKDPKEKGAAEKVPLPPPKPPSFRRERKLFANGVRLVAGCDEAGRGPLAGPVVAAAVILDPNKIPRGIDDSKRLTADERERLFDKICATASFAVAVASPARIDRDNILRASLWALARAVRALPVKPGHVFVDGRDRIAVDCNCEAVIGGDGIVLSIAAASIVAKVTRDRLMARLGSECPGYGFENHKGYSVPEHLTALRELGPTVHHRRSFAPVAALLRGEEIVDQEAFVFMADEAVAG